MKTLVIFEIPGAVLSLPLSDLVSVPTEGRFYVFEGKRYLVTELTEFLGFRNSDGKEVGTNSKLLELLKAVYDGDELRAMAVLAKLKNIGKDEAETSQTTAGGIIMPGRMPVNTDFDKVIFVRLQLSKSDTILPPIRLSALAAEPGGDDALVPPPEQSPTVDGN